LTNAFAAPAHAAAVGPDGPKHVEILIAAGRAAQFGHRPARQAFYGDRPESWRPYHPQVAKAIGPFAQTTAGSADFTSMLVEVGPGLDARIKQAKKKQNLIVLIIDPWSLDVGQLREHLQEYDVLDLRNCTAFVIWNDDDPETKAERAVLQKRLAKVFENKMAGARPFKGFRDDVDSLKKLENDLRDVLIQIHQSIVEREEVPRKAEGDQEVALAQVQGPGDTKPP
jgi:FxsC-like protein